VAYYCGGKGQTKALEKALFPFVNRMQRTRVQAPDFAIAASIKQLTALRNTLMNVLSTEEADLSDEEEPVPEKKKPVEKKEKKVKKTKKIEKKKKSREEEDDEEAIDAFERKREKHLRKIDEIAERHGLFLAQREDKKMRRASKIAKKERKRKEEKRVAKEEAKKEEKKSLKRKAITEKEDEEKVEKKPKKTVLVISVPSSPTRQPIVEAMPSEDDWQTTKATMDKLLEDIALPLGSSSSSTASASESSSSSSGEGEEEEGDLKSRNEWLMEFSTETNCV